MKLIVAIVLLSFPSCGITRESQDFRHSKNFTFLAGALASYEQETGYLPHDIGQLSWRVDLLRVSDPNIYKMFHLDEPWDSPHNKVLIKYIPFFLQDPAHEKGQTCYMGVSGKNCAFDHGSKVRTPKEGETLRVGIVVTVNTVPWTKPCDAPVQDVESGACIRWHNGRADFLGWDGGTGSWPKSPDPQAPGYKPVFRFEK